jgi:hypothetical protein
MNILAAQRTAVVRLKQLLGPDEVAEILACAAVSRESFPQSVLEFGDATGEAPIIDACALNRAAAWTLQAGLRRPLQPRQLAHHLHPHRRHLLHAASSHLRQA